MNPAANTGVSGGLAASLVIVVNWIIGLAGGKPMPPDVSAAWIVVFNQAFGYYFHRRSETPNLNFFLHQASPKPFRFPSEPPTQGH